MNIGVVGYGHVGKAVTTGFRQKGYTVCVNDPYLNDAGADASKENLAANCDLIFVCVPTPCKPNGEIDLSIIDGVVEEFSQTEKCPLLIIKSTVIPGTTEAYAKKYPQLKFANNPEFMREKTALSDFLNSDRVVIGAFTDEDKDLLTELYASWDCIKVVCDPTTAESIKYVSNIFLVLKVAYCLEMAKLTKKLSANPAAVMIGAGLDKRIGSSHLDPLYGKIPFHSPCLPKDLLAFLRVIEGKGEKSELLEQIWNLGVERNDREK